MSNKEKVIKQLGEAARDLNNLWYEHEDITDQLEKIKKEIADKQDIVLGHLKPGVINKFVVPLTAGTSILLTITDDGVGVELVFNLREEALQWIGDRIK